MKYHLMQAVVIVSDTLNYNLPVGSAAYVVAIDPHPHRAIPYYIRVSSEKKEYWVPECDLDAANEWISKESEQVIRDSLIDFALRTGNEALFLEQMAQEVDPRW